MRGNAFFSYEDEQNIKISKNYMAGKKYRHYVGWQ